MSGTARRTRTKKGMTGSSWVARYRSALLATCVIAGTLLVAVLLGSRHQPLFAKPVDIAAAYDYSCAVTEAGELYCWGEIPHSYSTRTRAERPLRIADPTDGQHHWVKVVAGEDGFCAIDREGYAYCAGSYGHGSSSLLSPLSMQRPDFEGAGIPARSTRGPFAELVFRYDEACYISASRSELGCESGFFDQAPAGLSWERVVLLGYESEDVDSAGCALRSDGVIRCWRHPVERTEQGGVLLPPEWNDVTLPANAAGSRWIAIASGNRPCAISDTHEVYCWTDSHGADIYPAFNEGEFAGSKIFELIVGTNGSSAACLRTLTSDPVCTGKAPVGGWEIWYSEHEGSSTGYTLSPTTRVTTLIYVPGEWGKLVIGREHACALRIADPAYADGSPAPGNGVYCWGDNERKQLGLGDRAATGVPLWVFGEGLPYDIDALKEERRP